MRGLSPSRHSPWAVLVIAAASLAVYANSFANPFVFDDAPSLLSNASLNSVWHSLIPLPGGLTTSGRPLLNFSFALNHALCGQTPWSYHAANVLIHLAAALTLLGLLRRTPGITEPIAFGAALLWAVHPLQTESVTYIVQRAESLAGLFYLLTLYAFVRARATPATPFRWQAMSVAACALGMTSKEILVTAPVMVLLYDRTFLSGSVRSAFRARAGYYAALFTTWGIQAWLAVLTGSRGGTAGFCAGVGWWEYGQTQFRAVGRYLGLTVWPHPLVIDYGTQWETRPGPVIAYAFLVGALLVATGYALSREPSSRARAIGFAGAWFFLLLLPTSLIPGTRQTMAEHRLYLPLAAVTVLISAALFTWLGRRAQFVLLAAVISLALLTVERNRTYASEVALWTDTVAHVPGNAWAWNNLGVTQDETGHPAQARESYLRALAITPTLSTAANNLGDQAKGKGDLPSAVAYYRRAIAAQPRYFNPRYSLANVLLAQDRPADAAAQFKTCLDLDPRFPGAELGLGDALAAEGLYPAAEVHLRRALALAPRLAAADHDLGRVLLAQGRVTDAIAAFHEAIRINPLDREAIAALDRAEHPRPTGSP